MDLHRHDERSTFDGFGKPIELATYAKKIGHKSLGISNHGNTNGLVQHYLACKEVGIKPILGVEGYFLPKYKEQTRGYHLCLFAKNAKGYRNINILQTEGDKIRYYNPIWTFELLEKYHEGIICTSACVAGYLGQMIKSDKLEYAKKYLKKMKSIFGDDFYIEIQPYTISEPGLQEKVNIQSINLANILGIKTILTSDSHRGPEEDFPTYLKMHEIANHNIQDIESTYKERYMPTDGELKIRFVHMHGRDYAKHNAMAMADRMIQNLKEIEDKVEDDIFKDFKQLLPKLDGNSDKAIRDKIAAGLKAKGKWTHKHPETGLDYITRIKQEYDVIKTLGFQDYFLIVAEYMNWAKENGINVGPGRGSACNCLVAYALGITEVDSLLLNLDFRRFLRKDKKKIPDIDVDIETKRRAEVIEHIINKYPGKTARIASYGLYKTDNLINDLAKVCGLPVDKEVEGDIISANKAEIRAIKSLCNTYISEDGTLDSMGLLSDSMAIQYNKQYDSIITHFTKLYKKVRYIGTHAAGVAVTGGDILDYTALREKDGELYVSYDLNDIDTVKVVKFDILGLGTMEEIGELRKSTGVTVNYDEVIKDQKVIDLFRSGNTNAIFQFDKSSVRNMLVNIDCDCFNDIIAANAMNRPGPLKSKMPEAYAKGKFNGVENGNELFSEYTKETYGSIVYQEQVQLICVNVAGMEWTDADKVMKMDVDKANAAATKANKEKNELMQKFITGAVRNGISRQEAKEMFEAMMVYSFNKGHAAGYSLIGVEEAFYKVYHPLYFWFCKIKHAPNEDAYNRYCNYAAGDGCVVMLPHVNYSMPKMRLRKVEGELCLQQGLSEVKNVGEKAAVEIYNERRKNGIFTSFDNFYDRCKSRVVTTRVIDTLLQNGIAQFNKDIYMRKVIDYNTALLMRSKM